MNRFEKSLIDNPYPKNDWEKYSQGSKNGENFCYERSLEEVVEYKRYFVKYKILRWLTDGRRRIQNIVDAKLKSVKKYNTKCTNAYFSGALNRDMFSKREKKEERLQFYQSILIKIDYVVENYTEYTYEELETIPDKIFGRVKTMYF